MDKPEEFHEHERSIITKQAPHFCPKCKSYHDDFKLHAHRDRLFYVIIDSLVHTVESFLMRWKCSLCRATFTVYPKYAILYKRYVRDVCISLCEDYVTKDTATYLDVSSFIGYTTQTQKTDERKLARSTVWRWLSFFGLLKNALRSAFDIIRQSAPNSTVFRNLSPIHPRKYRSKERKIVLERAFQFFDADAGFHDIWGHSFFPDLTTKAFWYYVNMYLQHSTKEVICEIERRKMCVVLV